MLVPASILVFLARKKVALINGIECLARNHSEIGLSRIITW